jgi:hypothetical protein
MDNMGFESTRYTIDEEDGLLKYAPTMAEFEAQLQKYNGSLTRWLVAGRLVVSPGVRYVLNTSGGWVINAIIELQQQEQIKQISAQFWFLQFDTAAKCASLTCKTYSDDGEGINIVHESVHENVEFPAAELEMMVIDDGPEEYITFYLVRED